MEQTSEIHLSIPKWTRHKPLICKLVSLTNFQILNNQLLNSLQVGGKGRDGKTEQKGNAD
jgi:hypothetical protein